MKKIILFIVVFLTLCCIASAQVKVYKGTSQFSSDMICNVIDGKVYKGTSSYTSDIEFTIDGNLTIEEFVAI